MSLLGFILNRLLKHQLMQANAVEGFWLLIYMGMYETERKGRSSKGMVGYFSFILNSKQLENSKGRHWSHIEMVVEYQISTQKQQQFTSLTSLCDSKYAMQDTFLFSRVPFELLKVQTKYLNVTEQPHNLNNWWKISILIGVTKHGP